MPSIPLATLIADNREDLLDRCREKAPYTASRWPRHLGIPLFLDHLVAALIHRPTNAVALEVSAPNHARELFAEGYTVGQLVHDYGDVCQSITDLAVEQDVTIHSDDVRTMNRCLEDAIANAVAEYANQERASHRGEAIRVRNLVYLAASSFDTLRTGQADVVGPTGDLIHESLRALRHILNESSADGTALR